MLVPGPTESMTPEGWRVLGCMVVVGVALFLAGCLYVCVRTGFRNPQALTFRNPQALTLLGAALVTAVMVGAGWYAIRRWVG